ncbi:BatA domain-containing protein [Draconibacterium sp. IB214405]|uniref:BatA domain-containing protein n=1 Tax=Draconibacterium sp. IB214405 TaxID=3097352 RepID=UPI002A17BA84|nr:BatA domain-containing protein [Draconibacterium sp. IB214405]MDX8340342.1 BatA domain-containing protein [Draconibacterium sp. IB214405]
MKFLYPTFLFALLVIAIPVIIHLFSFKRYKTVYFSNVSFLKDIKTESKKKSRLKQLLILAARILTIIFLVFAFARPFIPTNNNAQKQSTQLVAVYVDNSFSMNALSEQGQLLEVARNKALEICMAYPPGTKFRLFTNDLLPKHQHIFNREQFIQQVSGIQASPNVVPMSLIYNRYASENNDAEADKNLYFISDFQRSISDINNFATPEIFSYYIPLVPNEVANLYIDSCWVEYPAHRLGQEENMFVRIKNSSNQNYQNLPLKLFLNDSIKSITNFSVEAQNEIVANLKYNNTGSGPQLGKIEITDYPFTHDNNWYISYFVEPQLKALALYSNENDSKEGLNYLSALFNNDDYVQLDEMNSQNLQVNRLVDYNTIFLLNIDNFSSGLLNELESIIRSGTSVVLFPKFKTDLTANNNLLATFNANRIVRIDSTEQEISSIDYENKFYADVFTKREKNPVLPQINGHYRFAGSSQTDENTLLAFQNGDKALSQLNYQDGKVWVFAFPLSEQNESFARDVLFVPTLYNIVLNSLPKQEISFIVGKNNFINLPRNLKLDLNSPIEIEQPKTGERFIPAKTISGRSVRLEFGEQITSDGHYLIKNDDQIVASMAFNFDRLESDLRYLNNNEIESRLQDAQLTNATVIEDVESNFAEIFNDIQNGRQLWKWCLLLALFFILAEVLIARFWK